MSFKVMSFKERNLQRRIWNCVKPCDGSFSKIGEIEVSQISASKRVNVFQNTRLKDIRILRWDDGREQNGAVVCV